MLIIAETGFGEYGNSLYYHCNFSVNLTVLKQTFIATKRVPLNKVLKVQIIHIIQVSVAWGFGMVKGEIMKTPEKNLGGDGYVHYLDCGNDFTVVYTYQNIKFYTSKFSVYCISIIFIKTIFFK